MIAWATVGTGAAANSLHNLIAGAAFGGRKEARPRLRSKVKISG